MPNRPRPGSGTLRGALTHAEVRCGRHGTAIPLESGFVLACVLLACIELAPRRPYGLRRHNDALLAEDEFSLRR